LGVVGAALSAAAVLLAAVAPAYTQPPERPPWWKVAAIRTAISLTSEQAERLDAIYRESLPTRRRLRQKLAAQEKRVAEVLLVGPFDDEQVRPLIDRLFALDKERNVARTLMLIRMYRQLTPVQRARLAELSAQMPGNGRPYSFTGLFSRRE
jgi:Spy/CpxP family protein refolding chaperone